MNSKKSGEIGEELAAIMLVEKGYRIIARNFLCRMGEIDIVAYKNGVIAFVEVKTRLSDGYGSGREAVTAAKQQRIKLCAEYFLSNFSGFYKEADFQVIEISAVHITGLEF